MKRVRLRRTDPTFDTLRYGIALAIVCLLLLQFWYMHVLGSSAASHADKWGFLVIQNTKSASTIDKNTTQLQSYRRKFRRTTPLLDGTQPNHSVAILIAGQCHRFIYRDQSGPLFRSPHGNQHDFPQYDIHVYIALQCGTAVPSYLGTVDAPPYMATMSDTDMADWYMQRGATTVTIEIIDTASMDVTIYDIAHQATTLVRHLDGFNLSHVPAWYAEVRKFYMRHFVFSMSQTIPRIYDAYVFHREDNFFLEPLDLNRHYFDKHKPTDQPYIIVDEFCEFKAYSDKMYIGNHLGAALVFSSTKAEFMHWMKRFMLVGLLQQRYSYWAPWQAESFVHDTLQSVDVERIDLHRVDVRYNGPIKCVPDLYFVCMSDRTKNLARQHKLRTCGWRMPNQDWIFRDHWP